MKHIQFQVTAADEEKILKAASKSIELLAIQSAWMTAYADYSNNQGNPWHVQPMGVPQIERDQLYHLYGTRRGTMPLRAIRNMGGLLSCPMCGSSGTGNLDHYLPRSEYPEFSIMRANLLPACSHCNSESKKTVTKGSADPQRFIHPYFDAWADIPLWIVEFVPPYTGVRFVARPYRNLLADQKEIVTFHLQYVLGDQFHRSMANMFSTLPRGLKAQLGNAPVTIGAIEKQLGINVEYSVATKGMNSWEAAFFDGLQNDANAVAFMHVCAAALP
jgi:5-methylcytosine-specific restriction endonuclease McrA